MAYTFTRTGAQIEEIHNTVEDPKSNTQFSDDIRTIAGEYRGLWPDTGGSANKGDTYQTQVGGTPTGQYFSALQDTTVDPFSDDLNWREVVSASYVYDYSGITFPTVQDLISGVTNDGRSIDFTRVPEGTRVQWLGYYDISDGGSNWGTVKFGAHTEDGGSIFSVGVNIYIEANLKGKTVSVLKFGAKGNVESFDDAPFINKCNTYIQSTGWARQNVDLGGSQFTGAHQVMGFADRIFYLGETINMASYDNFDFKNALFLPHANFDLDNDFAIDMIPYNSTFKRFRIAKFKKGVKTSNGNLDGTVVRFKDIQATGMDLLFDVTLRSALVIVKDFKFDRVKNIALVHDCDKIHFKEGWINAGVFTEDKDAHFILDSSTSPSIHLDDVFYVPVTQTKSKCAIVNLGSASNNSPCRCYINGLLAGAESGRIALVNNFAKGATGRGAYININNGSSFTASVSCVRLFELPNAVSFTNQSGGVEEAHVESMVNFDEELQTFAAAEAAVTAGVYPEIWFNGYRPRNFNNLPRANLSTLNKLIRSKNEVFRAYNAAVTTTPVNVALPGKVRFSRGKVWKIRATNFVNPGADRYTEVLVAGDISGTTLTFAVNIQGTTVAPVFSASGGTLQVASTSGTNDFGIEIEQVVDATESFL